MPYFLVNSYPPFFVIVPYWWFVTRFPPCYKHSGRLGLPAPHSDPEKKVRQESEATGPPAKDGRGRRERP